MRLFVAIVPPPAAVAELARWLESLRPAAGPGLRWTPAGSWHLTLAFLGEVPDTVLPGLSTRLGRAAGRHPALDLAIAAGGAFPGPARARVLWAGVRVSTDDRDPRRPLRMLAASVAAGARRAGAPSPDEGRPFRPHLTLARLSAPADVRPLVGGLAPLAGQPWPGTDIRLIRSYLQAGPDGAPRYDEVARWPLRPR
jgi:2'-5' RNA ligase